MWWYAHLALQNHNILPADFMALPVDTRLWIMASDEVQAETINKLQKG